jgi:SAM-dependent methyltransferase
MITREEVISAYRLMLGREPEDESVITDHMLQYEDLHALRRAFLQTGEFRAAVGRYVLFEPGEPIQVQVDCELKEFACMIDHVEAAWTELGSTEPMWSVLTGDKYKLCHFESNSNEFYLSGQWDVDRFLTWLRRNDQPCDAIQSCLEFGCGVGRVTGWLSRTFPHVVACDISAPHLALASDYLRKNSISNTELVRIGSPAELESLPSVDAVFSVLVLQHNPPPVIARLLTDLLKKVRRGGVAYFQIPTYRADYSFDVKGYLASNDFHQKSLEMHLLPQKTVFAIAADAGCTVLEVQPDRYTGIANEISNTFLLRKN